MSIRFSNFFPTDRKERYYVEDRSPYDKYPEDRKERYHVEERRSIDKFPEDRRSERYHVEDRRSYDQFQESAGAFRGSSAGNAQIDWKETAEAHVFRLELPGVKKHEVQLEIEENGVLCISTEIRAEKEEVNDIWRRLERSSGRFFRRFVLPESADGDKAKAEMSNGVLTVTVPKYHFKKPMARIVQISGY